MECTIHAPASGVLPQFVDARDPAQHTIPTHFNLAGASLTGKPSGVAVMKRFWGETTQRKVRGEVWINSHISSRDAREVSPFSCGIRHSARPHRIEAAHAASKDTVSIR